MAEIKEGDLVLLKTGSSIKMVVGLIRQETKNTTSAKVSFKMADCYYFNAADLIKVEIPVDALMHLK